MHAIGSWTLWCDSSAAHKNSTVVWRDFYATIYTGWTSHRASHSSCVCWCSPQYLAELCVPVADVLGRRNLRSATRGLLNFSRYNVTNYGRRVFSYTGPHAWNSLPEHLRQTTPITLFKRSLKRFYSGRCRAQRIRDILFNGLYKFTFFYLPTLLYYRHKHDDIVTS